MYFSRNLLIIYLFFILVICSLVSFWINNVGWSPVLLVTVILTYGNAAIITIPILRILARGENLIQPIVIFLITASGYVVGSLFLINGGTSRSLRYELTVDNMPAFALTHSAIMLGLLCYIAAYYMTLGSKSYPFHCNETNQKAKKNSLSIKQFSVLFWTILLLIGIGLLGYFLFVSSSGGLGNIAQNIHRRTLLRTTDYYRLIFQFMQAACFIWFVFHRPASKNVVFVVFLAFNLFTLVSLGSGAPVILFLAFLFAINITFENTKSSILIQWRRYLLGAVAILMLVFVVLVGRLAWRDASVQARNSATAELSSRLVLERASYYLDDTGQLISSSLGGANLASIESFSRIVNYVPEEINYLYGQTFAWTLIAPIPRAIWPDKPVATIGVYLRRLLENENSEAGGVPPSWMGELYLNFGFLGIIVGQLVLGFLSAKAVKWFSTRRQDQFARLLYIDFALIFTFYLTKTEFKTALNRAAGFMLAFILAQFIIRKYISVTTSNNLVARIHFQKVQNADLLFRSR